MIDSLAQPVRRRALDPIALALARGRVPANAVTVVGTVGVVVSALTLVASGRLLVGSLAVGVAALADAVDGALARASGRADAWGAFLDSTLDRVADAAVFAGLAWWAYRVEDGAGLGLAVACLAVAPLVPYARAKAESVGVRPPDGVAARADRLVAVLAATAAVGLGAPAWVLHAVLASLLVAVVVTVAQRAAAVRSAVLTSVR